MKASELRIGNYVISNFLDGTEHSYQIKRGYEIDEAIHQYEPIPLSEEWLLKFGFEAEYEVSSDDDDLIGGTAFQCCNELKGCEEVIVNKGSFFFVRAHSSSAYDGSPEQTVTKIEYVHQLQNLYFALTGEELNEKTI